MRRFFEMQEVPSEQRPSLLSEGFTNQLTLRDSTCLICLVDICEEEKIIILQCSHVFHS